MKWFMYGLVLSGLVASDSSLHAGRDSGPGSKVDVVSAFDTDVYHIRFTGGEHGAVCILGDGSTDLDLYVYDACGRLVARSCGPTDDETTSWFVPCTGVYRIEVRNYGACANRYALGTN